MKKRISLILLAFVSSVGLAQNVGISDDGASFTPNSTSVLELKSTTRGVLPPRMNETLRDAITSPATGLVIYNTVTNRINYYNGTKWTSDASQKAYGSIYFEGNATVTAIAAMATYYNVAAAGFTAGSVNEITADITTGTLTYTGTESKHFHVVMNGSISSADNNQVMLCKIFLNGTPTGAAVERKISNQGDVGAFAVHADIMLATNDHLDVRLNNTTGTANLTMTYFYFFIMSMN